MTQEAILEAQRPETLQNLTFARILHRHGIALHDAQEALNFFCGNNWKVDKDLAKTFPSAEEGARKDSVKFSQRKVSGEVQNSIRFIFDRGVTQAGAGLNVVDGCVLDRMILLKVMGFPLVQRVHGIGQEDGFLIVSGGRNLVISDVTGILAVTSFAVVGQNIGTVYEDIRFGKNGEFGFSKSFGLTQGLEELFEAAKQQKPIDDGKKQRDQVNLPKTNILLLSGEMDWDFEKGVGSKELGKDVVLDGRVLGHIEEKFINSGNRLGHLKMFLPI